MDRGKDVLLSLLGGEKAAGPQPAILRMPEIIHGLRNLIQNAVDFAETTVWVEASWTEDFVTVRILDDGPGFPSHLIGRLGDPFMGRRRRRQANRSRPEYEGMGLGLFIAKTLLERSGANLRFANGADEAGYRSSRMGAVIEVRWLRNKIDARVGENALPIMPNTRFAET